MKNQSRAAAQTASIGNQDMMTFIPGMSMDGGAAGGGGTTAGAGQRQEQHAQSSRQTSEFPPPAAASNDSSAGDRDVADSTSMESTMEVPNPLLKRQDSDSMDEDLFNASLDALLKEVNSENYGSTSLSNSMSGDNDGGNDYDRFGGSASGGGMMDDGQDDSGDMEEDGTATSATTSGMGEQANSAKKKRCKTSQLPSSLARAASMTATSSMTNSSSDSGGAVAQGGGGQGQAKTPEPGAALHLHYHHGHHRPSTGQAAGAMDSKPSATAPQHPQTYGQNPQPHSTQHLQQVQHQPNVKNPLASSQVQATPFPQAQNYSARGSIVQLPQMFASRPISVAAGGAPGSVSLLRDDQAVSGSAMPASVGVGHLGVAAGAGTMGQQQPQQQQHQNQQHQHQQQNHLAFHPLQVPQHQMALPAHLNNGVNASIPNNLMPQMPNHPQQQHHQGHQNSNEAQKIQYQIPANTIASSGAAFGQPLPQSHWAAVASLGFPSHPHSAAAAMAASQPPTPFQINANMSPQPVSSTGVASNPSIPAVASSAAAASAVGMQLAATGNNTNSKPTANNTTAKSTNSKRKRSSLAISEDEDEKTKRRAERNLREQERSHRITERIAELRSVLAEAGVHFKPDRYSTLVSVVGYIKQLQKRSMNLDDEHRKLMSTISGADQMVKNGLRSNIGHGAALGAGSTTVQTHLDIGENTSSTSSENNDDEFLVFVQGIDYKFIFANCGVALAIASVDGRFVDCNEEFLRITNYTRKELLGEPRVLDQPGVAAPNGGVVTVSTSTSSNSTALSSAAAAALRLKSPDPYPLQRRLSPTFAAGNNGPAGPVSAAAGGGPHSSTHPPAEIRTRKQHLSLFNLLGREDMETVYAAMSRMLKSNPPNLREESSSGDVNSRAKDGSSSSMLPRSSSSDSLTRSTEESSSGNEVSGADGDRILRYTVDHWSGKVKHTRRKEHMLQLNISLVRTADGRPKFFNCALAEVDEDS